MATKEKDGRLISQFEVQEDQTKIEMIMTKANVAVYR